MIRNYIKELKRLHRTHSLILVPLGILLGIIVKLSFPTGSEQDININLGAAAIFIAYLLFAKHWNYNKHD